MELWKIVCCSLLVCLGVGSLPVPEEVLLEEWETFKLEYNKHYATKEEEEKRMKIFANNKLKIAKHNALYYDGLVTFMIGLNNFSDMLQEEVVARNGYKHSEKGNEVYEESATYFVEPANVALPSSIDWRELGAVTEIKNQGDCGSCWAFSATGSLEGQHFRKVGTLVSLSEQNLVDCSWKFGDQGCNGGLMDDAFKYVKYNHGIDTEAAYPYHGVDQQCRYRPSSSGCNCTGYVDIKSGNELSLQAAVATIGPVSVGIDASADSFMNYKSGVYFEPECSADELDHGVLVVGYGTTSDGKDFWIVKNSWGTKWGEQGYIRMSRNRHNNCGIATAASYPLM
uniref:Cathepsin L5 n=1 Tax=Mahanarva fimbriolata TaxID=672148 RepID=A0A7U3NJF7_9HEMI|nr:cathepsin L5 [Mahanarva fimbriolata]